MAEWLVEHYEHEFTAVTVGQPEIEANGARLNVVRPENLHFLLQLGQQGPGEIDYEVSLAARDAVTLDPVVSLDFVRPTLHDFRLMRAETPIMTGEIKSLNIEAGEENVKLAGKDYLHYLERRMWPYDADLSYVNWPDGFRFKVRAAPIHRIVADVLETIRDVSPNWPGPPNDATSPSYSLKFVVDVDTIPSLTRNYEISAFETSPILSLIQALSEAEKGEGGFDFYMTPELPPATTFRLVYPEIGDSDSPIFELMIDEETALANMMKLGYTDTGIEASHILGVGAGTANRQGGVNKHLRIVSARTRRSDGAADYGAVKNLDTLEDKTLASVQNSAHSVHEIPIVLDPNMKNPDGSPAFPNFWEVCKPGAYVFVDYNLKGHRIDSTQKIVSMDCTVNAQGDEQVVLGLNQFYELSDNIVIMTDP